MRSSKGRHVPSSRRLDAIRATSIALIGGVASPTLAVEWMHNELHLQYGRLDIPTFAGGGSETNTIVTNQHASGWKYGDNFYFIDFIDAEKSGSDILGEFYPNFSIEKMRGKDVTIGSITDSA